MKKAFKSKTRRTATPTKQIGTMIAAMETYVEDIYFLAFSFSPVAKASVNLFLRPFPSPKSQIVIQLSKESIVYQSPNASLLLKYLIYSGIENRERNRDIPLIPKANIICFNRFLSSLSFKYRLIFDSIIRVFPCFFIKTLLFWNSSHQIEHQNPSEYVLQMRLLVDDDKSHCQNYKF